MLEKAAQAAAARKRVGGDGQGQSLSKESRLGLGGGGGVAVCFNEGLQLLLAGCRDNAALTLFEKAPRCCTDLCCEWWCA